MRPLPARLPVLRPRRPALAYRPAVAERSWRGLPLIVGGYKALRQAAIQATDELVQRPIVLIGGCTGNGKTQLVCSRRTVSTWKGLLITAVLHSVEPCRISIRRPPLKTTWRSACLKAEQQTRWVLEDEGHMIGANHLPESLRLRMAQSPLAVVEDPFDVRLERLRESISIACIATLSPRMAKRKAGRHTASICISACLPSAVAWGCSVLLSSLNGSMRRWCSSSAPPTPGALCLAGTAAGRILRPDVSLSVGEKSRENSLSRQLAGGRSLAGEVIACSIVPGLRRKRLSRATGRRDLQPR